MRRPASHKYPAGREKDKWGSSEPAQVAVLEAGGVQAALSLLQMDGSSAIVKALATRLLAELSCSAQGATALYNDDAVPILAPLLRAGARSDTAEHAARALCNMSRLDPIPIEASCMVRITAAAPELVTLLWDAREVAQDVTNLGAPDVTNLILLLTGTLENLAGKQHHHEALCEAGAVAVLMATLGDDTTAPQYHRVAYHSALLALSDMAKLGTAATATVILAAVVTRGLPQEFTASPQDPFAAALKSKLLALATSRLTQATACEETAPLRLALSVVEALKPLPRPVVSFTPGATLVELLAAARARLVELEAAEARQARRESLGLGDLELPKEFECPITFARMKDPVVASDGVPAPHPLHCPPRTARAAASCPRHAAPVTITIGRPQLHTVGDPADHQPTPCAEAQPYHARGAAAGPLPQPQPA